MQQLFEEVQSQFQSTNQYDKYIKEVQKQYDVKIYRLHTFSRQYAQSVRNELCQKYQTQEYKQLPQGWHQNQRRLYVWFILCFIHLKMLEPNKFIDQKKYQKHWNNIKNTFFNKDVLFLKYQLLTLFKNKGRTVWKPQQDKLLKQAYQSFEKGQWNQVAKYFYFNSRGQFFKTPKQCRERFQNHLDSNLDKGKWTAQEDRILFEYVKKGNECYWAQIVPLLNHSRTQHMIKNRYKSVINKILREKDMTEGQAIVQALKNCNPSQAKQSEEIIVRDEKGILQVQSQQYIDEEQPPVIEHKPRKQTKRGRPKKVKEPKVRLRESQPIIVGGDAAPFRDSFFRNSRNSFNQGQIKVDHFNPSMLGMNSFARRKPNFLQNFSNSINNNSGNAFFSSGLNFSNCFNHRNEDDKNSLYDPLQSRMFKAPNESYEPFGPNGDSLDRSKRMLFSKGANDSLFSGIFK